MKIKLILGLILLHVLAFAQTQIDKTITVQSGQNIKMDFDYPQLIKISTWDKQEISITGTVNINGGENDDAFLLEHSTAGSEISISGTIPDLKKLPHRITIRQGGKKIMFKTKTDYENYAAQNGREYNCMSWGSDIEIVLEVNVPNNITTKVLSTYGTIEIKNFIGPIVAESTYGGVDAALVEKSIGGLKATTNYGQIYTNLDLQFKDGVFEDFHTVVSAKPGVGPEYRFESKYGNVYLRKLN